MKMYRPTWAAAFALASFATVAQAQSIQQGTIPVRLQNVATVTSASGGAPNFGVHSGDPRFLYVGEQNGKIRILDFNQPNPLSATDFVDIGAVLGAELMDDTGTGERGLLGAAFHPDFNNPDNPAGYRKFYTYTSESQAMAPPPPRTTSPPHLTHQSEHPEAGYNHQTVIREWTANAPDANGIMTLNTNLNDPQVHRIVMQIAQPGQFHNGGALAFGHDNYLYISLGDGGGGPANGGNDGGNNSNQQGHTNPGNPDTPGGWTGQGNAQDRRNPYGSILRIKPTLDADPNSVPNAYGGGWRVPVDNPFTPQSQATDPVPGWQESWIDEIYAHGFRNPFRISFDEETGKLYAADVGQDRNSVSREEVNLIESGGNYGWVIKTGTNLNNGANQAPYPVPEILTLTDPIAQYDTTQNGPGGLAVIGGHVYRGKLLPELEGKYVFGDLNRGSGGGRLLYTNVDEGVGLNTVFDLNVIGTVAKPNSFIHGVAADANGEIYYLFNNGQVVKLYLPGGSQYDPLLPNSTGPNGEKTFNLTADDFVVDGDGVWIDPPIAVGFTYSITGGTFTGVAPPDDPAVVDDDDDSYLLTSANGAFLLDPTLGFPASEHDFVANGGAVTQFTISGISVAGMGVDAADPQAFPAFVRVAITGLGPVIITVTPIEIPEPSTILLAASVLALVPLRRRSGRGH